MGNKERAREMFSMYEGIDAKEDSYQLVSAEEPKDKTEEAVTRRVDGRKIVKLSNRIPLVLEGIRFTRGYAYREDFHPQSPEGTYKVRMRSRVRANGSLGSLELRDCEELLDSHELTPFSWREVDSGWVDIGRQGSYFSLHFFMSCDGEVDWVEFQYGKVG